MEEIKKQARDEFDGFLKETFPEFAPHLIDTDENAGERFRETLDSIINLAVSKEQERVTSKTDEVWDLLCQMDTNIKSEKEYAKDIINLINTK